MDHPNPQQRFDSLCHALRAGIAVAYAYPDPRSTAAFVPQVMRERDDERRLWDQYLDAALGKTRPLHAVVLDAGCGLGAHTAQLREAFSHVVSVDADAARLSVAAHAQENPPTHAFAVWDFSDDIAASVDVVHCIQVIGHVPIAAQQKVFHTFASLLIPGGYLLLSVPFTNALTDICVKTMITSDGESPGIPISPTEYDALARNPPMGTLPVRHFALGSIQRLLKEAGFSVVEKQAYNWLTPDRGDMMLLARSQVGSRS